MRALLVAGAALAASTTALAQPAAPGGRDLVQTRAEAVERARTLFARVDANRDGAITQAEAQALRGKARGQRGLRARGGAAASRFDRLDSNRDNMISREEWAQVEARRSQRQAAGQWERGQRMAMRGRMGGAMLRAADIDGDSRITLQEAERAALQRFDRIDLNRDGRVTPAERQQARQQRPDRRG